MEFDAGHGYQDKPQIDKVALWVMGTLDEMQRLDLVELGGDSPLGSGEAHAAYERLKAEGFKPTLKQVRKILNRYMMEKLRPDVARLFRAVIDEGWSHLKAVVAQERESAENARRYLTQEQIDEGWTLL